MQLVGVDAVGMYVYRVAPYLLLVFWNENAFFLEI